ncbi:Uncharacterised protein [Vibrio cholerae]|nr:Uncharacterised protein [Vibrio cholerae]
MIPVTKTSCPAVSGDDSICRQSHSMIFSIVRTMKATTVRKQSVTIK